MFPSPSLPAGAAQCSSPWVGGIAIVFTSLLHRFASLGLKSRIDAWIAPVLTLWLHRFASLGLKSGIDAWIAPVLALWLHRFASLGLKSRIDARIAPDLTFWLHRFASLGLKSRITAAPSCRQVEWPACNGSCRYDAASDSDLRCGKEEWFRLQQTLPLR